MPPVDTLSTLIQIPTQSTELHDHHHHQIYTCITYNIYIAKGNAETMTEQ